ncbi:MAG: hypothetical protein AB2L14_15830 [Candidatus Xenobiia bacterium LiM19]
MTLISVVAERDRGFCRSHHRQQDGAPGNKAPQKAIITFIFISLKGKMDEQENFIYSGSNNRGIALS